MDASGPAVHGAGHSALYPNLRMPFQTSIRHGSVPVVLRTRSIVIAAPERNITEVAAGDIFAALSARDPRGAQRATAAPENPVSAGTHIRQQSPATSHNIGRNSINYTMLLCPVCPRRSSRMRESSKSWRVQLEELEGPRITHFHTLTHHSHTNRP